MKYDHLYKPWLVQRMRRREAPLSSKKGIDVHFGMDYMGSAEFEFGTLSKALQAMRAEDLSKWKVLKIESHGHKAWYVGGPHQKDLAERFFEDQLHGDAKRIQLKEATHIADAYGVQKHFAIATDTTGWWVIDAQPPFAFFRHKDDAELWLMLLEAE